MPVSVRPYSPPPVPSSNKMNLGYLLLPSRRSSMPAPYLNAQLGSPMRLASPRPSPANCRDNLLTNHSHMDMDNDDDLDFCCKGYESPVVVPQSSKPRSSNLFSPYRRTPTGTPVSQLGKRRGKLVPRLEIL